MYVHRRSDNLLQRVIAGPTKSISAFCMSGDGNRIALASKDETIKMYDVATGAELCGQIAKGINVQHMAWALHNPRRVFVAALSTLQVWDLDRNSVTFAFDCDSSNITSMEQSHARTSLMCMGTEAGKIFVLDFDKKLFNRPHKIVVGASPVVSVAWDLLSPQYLLVLLKNGTLSLRDIETSNEVSGFVKLPVGQSALAWAAGMPGTFVVCSERTGVLRTFNVSQPTPIALIKTGLPGIVSVKFCGKTTQCVVGGADGSVGLFDAERKYMVWSTQGGHCETVFASKFHPTDPDTLATCSYDSTVKVWNVRTLECDATLLGAQGVLYDVAWSPDGKRVVACSSVGSVYLYEDMEKAVATATYNIHKAQVYSVAWHPTEENLIATASGDGRVCVVKVTDGTMHRSLTYANQAAFNAAWGVHKQEHNLLAAALESGAIVIYDVARPPETVNAPVAVLKGHNSRAFNTLWHPLVPGRLITTSDDGTARFWNVPDGTAVVMRGHTSNVRGACFHHELAHIAYTGSWDATIRTWDIRTGVCLNIVNEHVADVYGLATHPKRPFTLTSTSRDTTVRVWNSMCDFPCLPMRVLLGAPARMDAAEVLRGQADHSSAALSGTASAEVLESRHLAKGCLSMASTATKSEEEVAAIASLMRLFVSPIGADDLFEGLACAVAGGRESSALPSSDSSTCVHAGAVVPVTRSRANFLEANARKVKGRGMHSQKRAEALIAAAQQHLLAGNIEAYCECMADIGDWNKALLVAPAAGIEVWRKLVVRRLAAAKEGDAPEDMPDAFSRTPLYVAAGQIDSLVEALSAETKLDEAFLVAAASAHGAFGNVETNGAAPAASAPRSDGRLEPLSATAGRGSGALPPLGKAERAARANDAPSGKDAERLAGLARKQAHRDLERGQPLRAAARYMAAGDVDGAVTTLYEACELEMAWVVSLFTKSPGRWSPLYTDLARRCEQSNEWKLSVKLLQAVHDRAGDGGVAVTPGSRGDDAWRGAARFHGPPKDVAALHTDAGLPMPDAAATAAAGASTDAERCRQLALAHDAQGASKAGLAHLRAVLAKRTWEWAEVNPTLQMLGTLSLEKLSKSESDELLCYASYLGGLKAMWLGYPRIVRTLFEQCRRLARQGGFPDGKEFPVPVALISVQELAYTASFDVVEAIQGLRAVAAASTTPPELKVACEKRIEHHQAFLAAGGKPAHDLGGALATAEGLMADHMPQPSVSILGGKGISAKTVSDAQTQQELSFLSGLQVGASSNRVAVGGAYSVTLAEAFSWARVTDFAIVGDATKGVVPT